MNRALLAFIPFIYLIALIIAVFYLSQTNQPKTYYRYIEIASYVSVFNVLFPVVALTQIFKEEKLLEKISLGIVCLFSAIAALIPAPAAFIMFRIPSWG